MSWAASVYVLCWATSSVCAWLLVRAYWRTHSRLLMWSAICFVMLAINNLLVVLDLLVFLSTDLSLYRSLATLIGLSCLLYGFIFEADLL
jgi:hypothetical protein